MSCCPPHATISSSLPYHRLSASSSIINHFPEVTSPSYSSCCARGLGTAIRVHRALQAELALHLPKPEAPLGLRLAAASCPQALRMDSEGCSLLTQPQGRHRAQPAHGTLTPGPNAWPRPCSAGGHPGVNSCFGSTAISKDRAQEAEKSAWKGEWLMGQTEQQIQHSMSLCFQNRLH